jgi:hypothetical protein
MILATHTSNHRFFVETVLGFLVLAVALSTNAQRNSAPSVPVTEPPGAGFRVLMPGTISEKKQNESHGTSSVTVVTLSSQVGNETYLVVYTTYPAQIAKLMEESNPDVIFGFSRDKLLKSVSGLRITNERAISLNGYPGREITFDGSGTILMRAYWAPPSFYEVMALKENPTYKPEVSRFLSKGASNFVNSFEILSNAGDTFSNKQYEPDMPPFLNLDDRLLLGGELLKRNYSQEQAGKWIFDLTRKAVSFLSPSEQDELKLLNDQANSALSLEEATEFETIKRKFERGSQLTKDDERTTNNLIRKALESLPPSKLIRYQFLMGKGVRAALAAK